MDHDINVGIIGDYNPQMSYHIATDESLAHAATALSVSVKSSWVPTESLAKGGVERALNPFDALWCGPGSPYKSMDGALQAIRFAREQRRPFIGT
jgi:CTP synthase (UTP-ammonia lyase)